MAIIGTIGVSLTANTSRLTKGLTRARRSVGRFGKSLDRVGSRLLSFRGLLAGVLGVGLSRAVFGLTAGADAAQKFANRLGIAYTNLIRLQQAGELSGIQVAQLNMALQRMTRRTAEAAMGTGEAQQAIKDLGLSAEELVNLSPDRAFRRVIRALSRIQNPAERLALAFKLFDSEGAAVVQMADNFDDLWQSVNRTRGLSESQVRAVERMNDAFTNLRYTLTTFVGPAIEFIANGLAGLAKRIEDVIDSSKLVAQEVLLLLGLIKTTRGNQVEIPDDEVGKLRDIARATEKINKERQRLLAPPPGQFQRFRQFTDAPQLRPRTMEQIQKDNRDANEDTATEQPKQTALLKTISDQIRANRSELVRI